MMKVTPRVSFNHSKNSLIGMSHVMSTPRMASGMAARFDDVVEELLRLKLRSAERCTTVVRSGAVDEQGESELQKFKNLQLPSRQCQMFECVHVY